MLLGRVFFGILFGFLFLNIKTWTPVSHLMFRTPNVGHDSSELISKSIPTRELQIRKKRIINADE